MAKLGYSVVGVQLSRLRCSVVAYMAELSRCSVVAYTAELSDLCLEDDSEFVTSSFVVSSSIIQRMLVFVLEKAVPLTGRPHGKKKKIASLHLKIKLHNDAGHKSCIKLAFLISLLDILLLKKDTENRTALVEPLFKHLSIVFMDKEWIHEAIKQDKEHAEAASDRAQVILRQNLLSVLEDISNSLIANDRAQVKLIFRGLLFYKNSIALIFG
ncbi:hypothetical protein Tco_0393119 [Tanacetum coccineum]